MSISREPSSLPSPEVEKGSPLPKGEGRVRVSPIMKRFVKARWRTVVRLLFVLLLVLDTSCSGKRITKANVNEVTEGMSKKQVESILGLPTAIDNADFVIMKKTTYIYRQGNDTVTIVFKDDKVTDKQGTLSE